MLKTKTCVLLSCHIHAGYVNLCSASLQWAHTLTILSATECIWHVKTVLSASLQYSHNNRSSSLSQSFATLSTNAVWLTPTTYKQSMLNSPCSSPPLGDACFLNLQTGKVVRCPLKKVKIQCIPPKKFLTKRSSDGDNNDWWCKCPFVARKGQSSAHETSGEQFDFFQPTLSISIFNDTIHM